MCLLDIMQEGQQILKTHGRFTEAAKDDFPDEIPGDFIKRLLDLFHGRLAFEPECGLLCHVLHRAQAERAGAIAAVCDIDVKIALPFRLDAQGFCERQVFAAGMCCINNHLHYHLSFIVLQESADGLPLSAAPSDILQREGRNSMADRVPQHRKDSG